MFITEMELLQARLAAGKRLNDSHILKEILQEDRSSERKRRMAEGERYYRGEHDSLQKDFRRSPISETTENGEEEMRMFFNPNRSNHHCVHPFHHTLVAQKTAYLVGREPTISVRNGDRAFEEMLTELADEHFNGVLQSWLTGAANKGVEYLHVYYDGEGNFRYCIVPAEEIIAIYDEEYQQELREVIRYYDIKVLDEGREKNKAARGMVDGGGRDLFYGERRRRIFAGEKLRTLGGDGTSGRRGSRNRTAWLGARAFYSAQEQ